MQIVGYDTGAPPDPDAGVEGRSPALLVAGPPPEGVDPGRAGGRDGTGGGGGPGDGEGTGGADGRVAGRTGTGDGGSGDADRTDAGDGSSGDADRGPDGAGEVRSVRRVGLAPGTRLDYALGERRCAGAVDGARHHDCGADRAPYCEAHDSTWVCARCTGTCLKSEMDCFEEHAVYLAAFAPDAFKVGVTRLRRLRTRLREQGADRGAHVHTVSNGRIARELEAEIADRVPVPDRVPVARKVEGFGQSVDADRWRALLAEFDVLDRYRFDYGLDLPRRPVAATMATGRVRGVKGRVLVLDRAGTTYAVDMRELVGHEVVGDGRADDDGRQTSLAAF